MEFLNVEALNSAYLFGGEGRGGGGEERERGGGREGKGGEGEGREGRGREGGRGGRGEGWRGEGEGALYTTLCFIEHNLLPLEVSFGEATSINEPESLKTCRNCG